MWYAGIDPGAKGAWAVVDSEGRLIARSEFSGWTDAADFLRNRDTEGLLGIEKVHAAPGNGVSSSFSFGANYGGWLALLEVLKVPHVHVPPQSWQPKMLGSFPAGDSKKASIAYVNRRYPGLNLKAKDSGVSDAICIALYTSKYK